jgi:prolyl oligopeptidase
LKINLCFVSINLLIFLKENWVNIIGENKEDILKSVIAIYKEYLVVQYIRDVKPALEIRRLSDGHFLKEIPLTIGSIRKLSGHRNDNMMFFSFSTFLTPLIIYSFDFSNKTAAIEVRINKNRDSKYFCHLNFQKLIF